VAAFCLLGGARAAVAHAQEPCPILETPGLDTPGTSNSWLLTMSVAAYPQGDTRASRSDSARVEFVVAADGSIPRCSVRIVSITDSSLSDVVIDAVSKARWRPARRDGAPVASRVQSTEYVFTPGEAARLNGRPADDNMPVVEPPQLLSGQEPEYPQSLLQTGRAGRVLVAFTIQPDGRVDMKSVTILESSDALFSSAVRRALATFRYSPPMRPGSTTPTSFNMQQPFLFAPPR
jgi:TonB family protein